MSLTADDLAKLADGYTAAWNTGSADAVAGFYAEDGQITINGGDPWLGRTGVRDMAAGFFADVPDLVLSCDGIRAAGTHVVYLWTFTGHDAGTNNPLEIHGWEEWTLDVDGKVQSSLGWYDAEDYARQVEGR
nr:nuclear transport factor 2 family protein [uncultured Hyphomonas sp.]